MPNRLLGLLARDANRALNVARTANDTRRFLRSEGEPGRRQAPSRKEVGVFVSYAHASCEMADQFYGQLAQQLAPSKKYDYRLWWDKAILTGERWHESIREALEICDVGLLLLSPAFLASQYIVREEIPRFIGDDAKPVLPIMLEQIDIDRHDLKGIEARQIFWPKRQAYADCLQTPTHAHELTQRRFVELLFREIEERLDRLYH